MGKKLTTEEVKQRMYELVGSEYEMMGEYVNNKTKFKIKHVACDFEYEVNWNLFLQGRRCPKCAGNYKYTDSEISELVANMTKGEYTKLSTYKNANTKFKIRHNTCGHEFEVPWASFQSGSRCPKCAGTMKLTTEDIKERIYSVEGDNYELLSEYVNAKTKIKIKHVACGHQYETLWSNFQQDKRCPKCAGKHIYKDSEISELISEMTDGEYTKLSRYKDSKAKFKIRHNTCKHEYEVNWNNFRKGHRCPKCSFSKGEKFIEGYLTNHNISFATQVRFSDCKYKNTLPFDFGILNSDGEVVALLEFDGEQHFIPVEVWGGEEALQQTQIRDAVKDRYCKDNNIPLLRIKYNEDIEERLNLFLAQERVKV